MSTFMCALAGEQKWDVTRSLTVSWWGSGLMNWLAKILHQYLINGLTAVFPLLDRNHHCSSHPIFHDHIEFLRRITNVESQPSLRSSCHFRALRVFQHSTWWGAAQNTAAMHVGGSHARPPAYQARALRVDLAEPASSI
jgi:hypothetical protein